MNARILIPTELSIVIGVPLLMLFTYQPKPATGDKFATLHNRVVELERELSSVRQELERLYTNRSEGPQLRRYVLKTNGTSSIQPPAYGPKGSGKIWGEGEVNGWKYYDIPLSVK